MNKTMTMSAVDQFGAWAAQVAMEACAAWVKRNNYAPATVQQIDQLVIECRAEAQAAALVALDDAREALEAGMIQVAQATAHATMVLAGTKAAQTVFGGAR